MDYSKLASDETIQKTVETLVKNGFAVSVVNSAQEAKIKALELIPKNAEVMTMSSVTVDTIGLAKELNESGNYISVKSKLSSMDKAAQGAEMQKLGAAPEYTTGSVHAITEDCKVLVVSNTGSQLPAYAYVSSHVIWVVGAQKIVKDMADGMNRVWQYILPLETERAKKAYGLPDGWISNPSKILEVGRETSPGRINIIIVKEVLGF